MGKGIRYHIALSLFLEPVIANGRRGLQSRFDVARFDKFPRLLRVICPHSGKAISLQLDPDLDRVRVYFIHSLLCLLRFRQNSEQILYVMADLVRDHVSLRKLTGLATDIAGAASFKVAKERGVEINLAIVRAVEGSDC